jgi:hypothetical protein
MTLTVDAKNRKLQKHEMSDKCCAANGGTPFLDTGDGFITFRPSGLRVWPFSYEKTSKRKLFRGWEKKKREGKTKNFRQKEGKSLTTNP